LATFEIRSWFMLRSAWIMVLLFLLPGVDGITGTCHYAQPLVMMSSCELFCPGYPQTTIHLMATSQVARITDLSYHARHWGNF
jgi:hypothetical protein